LASNNAEFDDLCDKRPMNTCEIDNFCFYEETDEGGTCVGSMTFGDVQLRCQGYGGADCLAHSAFCKVN